jgi:hypothetical protein
MRRLLLIAPLLLVALLASSVWTASAQAAVARNSATFTKCTAYPCTNAHTVAGADPFLAVCVTWWHYLSTPTITAATWNGLTLTLADTASNPSCGHACKAALYILPNPPAATANTSIIFSSTPTAAVVGTISFTGVDPTTPTGTAVLATGAGSPASVTVSSASGELVLDCLNSLAAGSAPSVASGQTSNWSDFDAGGYTHNASSYVSGTPSTVSAWTLSGSPQWAMLGLSIKPAGGGGGGGGSTPGTQRVISWTDNATNEACFRLQWQTDQSAPNWVDLNACLPPNTVSYANNIGTQTGDCYRIEATNAGGSSGFTDPVCAAAPPPPPPPPLPPPGAAVASPFTFDIEEDLL